MAVNAPPVGPTIRMKGLRGMKPGEVRVVPRKKLHHEFVDPDFVFPGCMQMPSRSGLPMDGNALRHTFKTIHAEPGISETLSALRMGARSKASRRDISQKSSSCGPAIRAAQEQIRRHVFDLLGLKLGGHHDAPLVPSLPTRSRGPALSTQVNIPHRPSSLMSGSSLLSRRDDPMEHKGVEYFVIRLTDDSWRWEVKFGDGKSKSGVTRVSRALAIKFAKIEIDRAVKDTK